MIENIAQYRQAGLGKSNCSGSSGTSVSGFEDCKHSALALGITFKGAQDEKGYPRGCYVYMGKIVVWNQHSNGGTNNDASPVCKRKIGK